MTTLLSKSTVALDTPGTLASASLTAPTQAVAHVMPSIPKATWFTSSGVWLVSLVVSSGAGGPPLDCAVSSVPQPVKATVTNSIVAKLNMRFIA